MTQTQLPHGVKRAARALIVVGVLGAAGCMTRPPAVTRAARVAASTLDSTSNPAEDAVVQCEQFACEQ